MYLSIIYQHKHIDMNIPMSIIIHIHIYPRTITYLQPSLRISLSHSYNSICMDLLNYLMFAHNYFYLSLSSYLFKEKNLPFNYIFLYIHIFNKYIYLYIHLSSFLPLDRHISVSRAAYV